MRKIRVKFGPERLMNFEFVFRMVSKIYLSGPELEMKKIPPRVKGIRNKIL